MVINTFLIGNVSLFDPISLHINLKLRMRNLVTGILCVIQTILNIDTTNLNRNTFEDLLEKLYCARSIRLVR